MVQIQRVRFVRWSLIRYLAIVVGTIICTRILDHSFSCSNNSNSVIVGSRIAESEFNTFKHFGSFKDVFGTVNWPELGYGSHLNLKIYVYQESEVEGLKEILQGRDHSIKPTDCIKGQWGTQVKIHQLLLKSNVRTMSKSEAHLFFVPCYVKCVRMKGGLNDKEINIKFKQVLQQLPHFRRSGGRDHIFVFPSGAGAHLFKHWSLYLNRSIFLTPEGDRTDKRNTSAFNTWKDIIIPGNVDNEIPLKNSPIHQLINPLPLSKRKYLANFLGRAQGKSGRLKLVELAKQFPDELEVPSLAFTGPSKFERKEYFNHLRNAKFCLAPRGESSWTLRFYESFFVECVPVILSDEIELPFENVLKYNEFSIKWPASKINEELVHYLQSINDEEIERMIVSGRSVRCLWLYTSSDDCTAMTGILWELQRKVRTFHHSPHTFWLHNRTIVDRNLVPMSHWTPPFTLP